MSGYFNAHLTPIQLLLQTKLTREGERSMKNHKPYRTKEQKRIARDTAFKTAGGYYRSDAPVSFHK